MNTFNDWVSGETMTHKSIGAVYYNTGFSMGEANAAKNAVMTIYLRLHMIASSSGEVLKDANKAVLDHKDWDMLEFARFKQKVKEQADAFWNNNTMCLVTPKSYSGLNWPPGKNATHRLNIDCRLCVVWARGPGDAHRVIRCARLKDDAVDSTTGRSHWELYDSGDVNAAMFTNLTSNCGNPVSVEHRTIPHEIGHAIGLPHVGTFYDLTKSEYQCKVPGINPATTDWSKGGKDPYANFSTEDMIKNIMGYGQQKDLWNFLPWIYRIQDHTRHESFLADWRFSKTTVAPKPL